MIKPLSKLACLLLFLLLAVPQLLQAQTNCVNNRTPEGRTCITVTSGNGNLPGVSLTYVPLEPLPGVDQRGVDFGLFLSGAFKLLITFGALFAVVMLVVAGIGYMLSESAINISKAKDRAKAALWGLLLLASCWLILNAVNPNLLKFNLFNESLRRSTPPSTAPANQASGRSATPQCTPPDRLTCVQGTTLTCVCE